MENKVQKEFEALANMIITNAKRRYEYYSHDAVKRKEILSVLTEELESLAKSYGVVFTDVDNFKGNILKIG